MIARIFCLSMLDVHSDFTQNPAIRSMSVMGMLQQRISQIDSTQIGTLRQRLVSRKAERFDRISHDERTEFISALFSISSLCAADGLFNRETTASDRTVHSDGSGVGCVALPVPQPGCDWV